MFTRMSTGNIKCPNTGDNGCDNHSEAGWPGFQGVWTHQSNHFDSGMFTTQIFLKGHCELKNKDTDVGIIPGRRFGCPYQGQNGCTNQNGQGWATPSGVYKHIQRTHDEIRSYYCLQHKCCNNNKGRGFTTAGGLDRHLTDKILLAGSPRYYCLQLGCCDNNNGDGWSRILAFDQHLTDKILLAGSTRYYCLQLGCCDNNNGDGWSRIRDFDRHLIEKILASFPRYYCL